MSTGPDGLTEAGATAALDAVTLPDLRRSERTRARLSAEDMVRALVVADGEIDADDLLVHRHDSGRESPVAGRNWFDDVGREILEQVPGVQIHERDVQRPAAEFVGVAADGWDDDHTRPLAEIRESEAGRRERALDAAGVSRGTERREHLASLHRRLVEADGEVDEADLTLRRGDVTDLAGDLEALPGVRRRVDRPEPSDMPIDTYQDVLDAEERLERGSVEMWSHTREE